MDTSATRILEDFGQRQGSVARRLTLARVSVQDKGHPESFVRVTKDTSALIWWNLLNSPVTPLPVATLVCSMAARGKMLSGRLTAQSVRDVPSHISQT